MPHNSVKAAEKAAIEGDAEAEWDTQQCRALNDDLLSSSPTRTQVASTKNRIAFPTSPRLPPPEIQQQEDLRVEVEVEDPVVIAELPANGNGNRDQITSEQAATFEDELNPHPIDKTQPTGSPQPIQIRRDSRGKLRPFAPTWQEHRPAEFSKNYQKPTQAQAQTAMDDFTQRSSMSATQENPQYLYDQFHMQETIREDCPSTALRNDDSESEDQGPEPRNHDPKHASASTAYTYQENDTGHIHLAFDAEPVEEEPMEESQDGSYAMPVVQRSHSSFEPKTPAPPINPFQQKGSVMKGYELFGATQPSSIGRHMAGTPTSSRPSPDVYNDFSSPPKYRARVLSSPIRRGLQEPESELNDATPLQSSVRNMLGRSQSSRAAQSFDTGPSNMNWVNPEPRPYVSMQQSQEKRRRALEPDFDSGDDSDMEETPRNRNRKAQREIQIQQELSRVELRKRTSSNPRSSAPNTTGVEVPSTGRRRSFQDDYLAQCTSHDARDTQQDDVIVDSQAAAVEAPEGEQLDSSKPPVEDVTKPLMSDPPQVEEVLAVEEDAEVTQNTNSSDPEPNAEPEPSLPLQELSLNMHTPSTRPQSDAIDTVPETSPPDNRLRPMGEIASLSFGASEELPENFPGFTPDLEFENAMQIRSSPKPPTRVRSFGRAPKSSVTSSGLGSPRVNPVSSVTSSALSSPPGSAVLEKVAAEVSLPQGSIRQQRDSEAVHSDTDKVAPRRQEERAEHKSDLPAGTLVGSASAVLDSDLPLIAAPAASVAPTPVGTPQEVPRDEAADATASLLSQPAKQAPAKRGLRTYSKPKGPSRNLRRSIGTPPSASPRQFSRVAKTTPAQKPSATPQSTPRKAAKSAESTPIVVPEPRSTSAAVASKRTSKRKSGVTVVQDDVQPTRASKRQSTATAKDSRPDPLALSSPVVDGRTPKAVSGLFTEMTFAVSYVGHERDKDEVTKAIFDQGGRILPDGFNSLFATSKGDENEELLLSPSAKSVGFVALIADEHSRKAKYMQALALGLPCVSGHWITACVTKNIIVDWSPYLLCAGESSILGNAHKSRVLQPYPARDAKLEDTFANRDKLLEGKSVLLVTGKGKGSEKRKAYTFLAHALGPTRISQVTDYQDARKKLSEDKEWDLLYVDTHEKAAEEAVFGTPTSVSSSASRKRKRGPTAVDDPPAPKKIRIISNETMIQSLILGQLLDD